MKFWLITAQPYAETSEKDEGDELSASEEEEEELSDRERPRQRAPWSRARTLACARTGAKMKDELATSTVLRSPILRAW